MMMVMVMAMGRRDGDRPEATSRGAVNPRKFADTDNRLIAPLKRTARPALLDKAMPAARNQGG